MYVLVYANGFDQVCIDVRKKNSNLIVAIFSWL